MVPARSKRAVAESFGRSRRTLLRHPTSDDRREICKLRRDSWRFLAPWEARPPGRIDPCGKAWFARFLATSDEPRSQRFLLCRRSDDAILGVLSLGEIARGPLQSAYLGYWIGAAHARQGYMGEGIRPLLRQAFRGLKLHRVEANIRPENSASIALVRRAGFRREGYSPRYLKIVGRWCDHERWALLADEQRALRGAPN